MKKKFLALLLIAAMILTITACGNNGDGNNSGGGNAGDVDFESFTTIGEFMDVEASETVWQSGDKYFVYAFGKDGSYYRVIAEMTEEEAEALFAIDYADENYEEKQNEIIEPLKVTTFEKLDDQILSEEDCAALVGKTGQELLDDGWTTGMGYDLSVNEFWLGKGPFYYTVVFDGDLSGIDVDTFDPEEGIKDLVVKSVDFLMMGDAANLDAE